MGFSALQTAFSFFKPKTIQSSSSDPNIVSWNANIKSFTPQTQVVVEEGQLAVLLLNQSIAAILENGVYPLAWAFDALQLGQSANLQGYFFSTKTFTNQRWGTPTPIMVNDTRIGMNALRAHGIFSFELDNPKRLWQQLPIDYQQITTDDLAGSLRAMILDHFTKIISENQNNILQFMTERQRFSDAIANELQSDFKAFGLRLVDFIVQSVSAPENQANSMAALKKIEKLNDMLRQGLITQAEYDEKKQQLLKDV